MAGLLCNIRKQSSSEVLATLHAMGSSGSGSQDQAQAQIEEPEIKTKRRRITAKRPEKPSDNITQCDASSDCELTSNLQPMRPAFRANQLRCFIFQLLEDLPADNKNRLAILLCEFMEERYGRGASSVVIRVGSVCSGSELFMNAFDHLSDALKRGLGLHVVFDHVFAAEKDGKKRD